MRLLAGILALAVLALAKEKTTSETRNQYSYPNLGLRTAIPFDTPTPTCTRLRWEWYRAKDTQYVWTAMSTRTKLIYCGHCAVVYWYSKWNTEYVTTTVTATGTAVRKEFGCVRWKHWNTISTTTALTSEETTYTRRLTEIPTTTITTKTKHRHRLKTRTTETDDFEVTEFSRRTDTPTATMLAQEAHKPRDTDKPTETGMSAETVEPRDTAEPMVTEMPRWSDEHEYADEHADEYANEQMIPQGPVITQDSILTQDDAMVTQDPMVAQDPMTVQGPTIAQYPSLTLDLTITQEPMTPQDPMITPHAMITSMPSLDDQQPSLFEEFDFCGGNYKPCGGEMPMGGNDVIFPAPSRTDRTTPPERITTDSYTTFNRFRNVLRTTYQGTRNSFHSRATVPETTKPKRRASESTRTTMSTRSRLPTVRASVWPHTKEQEWILRRPDSIYTSKTVNFPTVTQLLRPNVETTRTFTFKGWVKDPDRE